MGLTEVGRLSLNVRSTIPWPDPGLNERQKVESPERGAGKMAQWLRALVTLSEDLDLVSTILMLAYIYL